MSRDERYLIFSKDNPGTGSDIVYVELKSGKLDRAVTLGTNASETQGQLRPDGKFLAYLDCAALFTGRSPSTRAHISYKLLGTAAYMSPEQARGENTDARSDVFSFGCVLYEMLSGQQAFQGKTVSDILAGVLRVEPDLTLLPPDLTPTLHELLRRCLDKNAKRRWQAVGDLKIELEIVAADPLRKPEVAPHASPRNRSLERVLWISVLAAVSMIAACRFTGSGGHRHVVHPPMCKDAL